MDYLCAKFGDFSFSRFGFIVRTESHNHKGGWLLYSREYRRRVQRTEKIKDNEYENQYKKSDNPTATIEKKVCKDRAEYIQGAAKKRTTTKSPIS